MGEEGERDQVPGVQIRNLRIRKTCRKTGRFPVLSEEYQRDDPQPEEETQKDRTDQRPVRTGFFHDSGS